MKPYKEFQFGLLLFAVMLPVHAFLIYAFINKIGDRPLDITGMMVINAIFIALYLLFYGMTTIVKEDKITVIYGIGIIRFNIKIQRIKAMREVVNPIYYGWGIRFFPNGILYNISGSKAVEISFHDSKRVVRIGSKEPSVLLSEIDKRIIKL